MKLNNKNPFSIKIITFFICTCFCASFLGNYILKKFHSELFTHESETIGENGAGKLMQTTDGLYTYRVFEDTNEVIIVCYNGAMVNQETEVIIPEKINGYNVTTLDEASVSYNEYINRLILPTSINSIRRCIGDHCPNLKEIIFLGDEINLQDDALKYSKNDYFKGKVYTKKDNGLWKYAKENGIKVFDINEMDK